MPGANNAPSLNPEPGNVLIVEDEPELRRALRRMLTAAGHSVLEAGTSRDAEKALGRAHFDVVLLDVNLPDGSGLDLLDGIRSSNKTTGVVVLTASNTTQDMREALRRGATAYLHKPVDALTLEAQVAMALSSARAPVERAIERGPSDLSQLLELLPVKMAIQLSHAWDLRHVETGAHVRRMAESAQRLALELGRSDGEARMLGSVAMLHDIGKIAIPDAILTKPGKLTDEEFSIMKRHAEIGGKLLGGSGHPFLELAATVARSHHERWNGTGYPDGLVGQECPWEARLVGVVDVYDALGQSRCYKDAWPQQRITELFQAERGRSFDAEIIDALFAIIPDLERVKSEHPDPMPDADARATALDVALRR